MKLLMYRRHLYVHVLLWSLLHRILHPVLTFYLTKNNNYVATKLLYYSKTCYLNLAIEIR